MSSDNSDTAKKIVEATWALMETGGGHGVRMSDIAKSAGISRQAVYLHFETRADLLIATTRYMDDVMGIEERLAAFRAAPTGIERLDAFIKFWGEHVPQIQGVAIALLAMQPSDEAAASAWNERMEATREGCHAVMDLLHKDGRLADTWTVDTATDLFWSMLSIPIWLQLTTQCGWSEQNYVDRLQVQAKRTFVK